MRSLYVCRCYAKSLVCPASCVTQLYENTNVSQFVCICELWYFLSQQTLAVSITIATSLAYSPPLTPSPCLFLSFSVHRGHCKTQALRRFRGSGLTDRWISPQAPRAGIVQEAFLSHWDPCGLRIPGFCCNNQASHTAKRKIQQSSLLLHL